MIVFSLNQNYFYYREEEGLRFIESVFRYIFSAADIQHEKVIKQAVEVSDSVEDKAMTTAERLINRGKEQGIEPRISTDKHT